MLQDRRRHSRKPITLPVYVGLNSPCSGGILHDVSAGGMALDVIVGPRPASDDVILDLNVPGAGEHLEVQGRITWTKEPENRIGFEFVNLTELSHQQIERWLFPTETPPHQTDASEMDELHVTLERDVTPEISILKNTNLPDERGIGHAAAEPKNFQRAPIPPRSQEAKKLVSRLDEKVAIPNLAKDDASVDGASAQYPLPQLEEKAKPAVFRAMDARKSQATEDEATESRAIRVPVSERTVRDEKQQPVTNGPEMQSSGMPHSSALIRKGRTHLAGEIRKRFVNESAAQELDQKDLSWAPTKDAAPVQHSLGQIRKPAEAADLRAMGATETKSAAAGGRAAAVNLATPGHGLPGGRKEPPTIERGMPRSQTIGIPAAALEHGDNLVQSLRSSFGPPDTHSMGASSLGRTRDEALSDWQVLRQWIVAAVVLFVLIVSLAAARWIYTTPALDQISSASDIAKMVLGSSSTNGSGSSDPVRSDGRKNGSGIKRKSNPGSKGRDPAGERAAGGKTTQFAAQNESIPDRQPEKGVGAGAGHVSLLPAAELPDRVILPQYPSVALEKNLQGRVVLKAVISKDGILQNIRLVGAPSALSSAALEAVKKWRYRPRMENGRPVEVETQITMDFEK